MSHSHHSQHAEAVAANTNVFNEEFAKKYENTECMQTVSLIFSKYLLEYDVNAPRKTDEESSKIVGDPYLLFNGFSIEKTLPGADTYLSEFPKGLIRPGIKVLDFACGTGLFTHKLFPYLRGGKKSELVGIDISKPFLSAFDKKAKAETTDDLVISSHLYDILDPALQPELDAKFGSQFDVIVCTLSYHHIENHRDVTKKLATFLKPQGWLVILDFYNEDVEKSLPISKATHAVRHMGGLKKDALVDTLSQHSGLKNVSSAREGRTFVWQTADFINNHSREDVALKVERGELETKKDDDGEDLYLIEVSFILAIGQKA